VFGALTRSATPWPSSVQRPLPADQLSVPAQQGLRADQEGPRGRARKDAAEGAEQQAVGGLEARSMDLPFEDTELLTEGENLDLERGLALAAEDEQIDQEADDGVDEAEDHEVGSRRSGRTRCKLRYGFGWLATLTPETRLLLAASCPSFARTLVPSTAWGLKTSLPRWISRSRVKPADASARFRDEVKRWRGS
jgi:hypothetical protein